MKKVTTKIGFWSAICLTGTLVAYTIGMQILLLSKPGQWRNLDIYAKQINESWHGSLTFCHVMVFIAAPLYLILITCLDQHTGKEQKIFTRLSQNFAIVLVVLSSINYFIQFSMVKQSLSRGHLAGLEQFIQLNPSSAVYAMATLGWTLFLGLSSFFVSRIFTGSGVKRIIKYAFISNGIFCMIGFFGYIIDITVFYVIYLIGMGVALLGVSFFLILFFKKNRFEN